VLRQKKQGGNLTNRKSKLEEKLRSPLTSDVSESAFYQNQKILASFLTFLFLQLHYRNI